MAYEVLAFTLSHDSLAGVRNGADVLLKSVFVLFGGRNGLLVFGALLVGTRRGARLAGPAALRDRSRAACFVLMMVESVVYALAFGLVTGLLTGLLLGGLARRRGAAARLAVGPGGTGPRHTSS